MNALTKFFEDRKNNVFFFAYLLVAITTLLNGLIFFYVPIYLNNIGLSGFQIGVLFGLSVIVGLFFVFHIGVFTDRVSPRKMAALGLLLTSIYFIGFSQTTSFSILLLLFLLSGVGFYIFALTMDSFILKKVNHSVGKTFGRYSAIRSIPYAAGVLFGGYLLFLLDFNIVFLIVGFLTLCSIGLVLYIPDTKKSFESLGTYIKDFLNPRVLFFSILLLIFTLHWGVESVTYSLFLKHNLGLNIIQIGWYISVPIVFLGISSIFLGKRFDKDFSTKKLLLVSFLVSGFGFALMAMTTNPWLSVFFRIIHEIGDGAFSLFLLIGAKTFFTRYRIGGNYGLITLVTVIGRFLGSVIFSPIGSAYGYQWPHIISGLLIFVSGLFIFFFKKE